MYTFDKPLARTGFCCGLACFALATMAPAARAAIVLTADPEVPVGAAVETIDPESTATPNARGLAGTRQLRQTFQNPADFTVGEIILSLDLTGEDGGLVLEFFEVADINADTWAPIGGAIETISLNTTIDLPPTASRLSLALTDANLFTLPQRNTGTEGYGIEISNFDDTTTIGVIRHSNSGVDDFAGGKYYAEGGDSPGGGLRDYGVWLLESTIIPPDPGDTDDDGDVDLNDLIPIRTNFLGSVATRIEGDLNGDGTVDTIDFREWKSAFLSNGGSLAGADLKFLAAVPEPGTAGLIVLAGLAAYGYRKRLRK